MVTNPAPNLAPAKKQSSFWRVVRLLVVAGLGLVLIAAIVTWFGSYPLGKAWVESNAGRRTAAQGLAKLIKVDGKFSPIQVKGWNLQIDSYQGQGWPGEAIGSMDLADMQFHLNPAALWRGAYRIDSIDVAQAKIVLSKPNDALKRPTPPKKPRPWYAFLLPSRFECGPIICPHAELEFPFQSQGARIVDAHVQADLIGKDLRYTATSGTLEFPYLPPLHIDYLQMTVTRPVITVAGARLRAVDPNDPARLNLKGSIGQRENKTVDAEVEIVDMPIEHILPPEVAPLVHGRATGRIHWQRDASGAHVTSEGEVNLAGASINDLSIFKQLALLHDNPDLQDFTFDVLQCKFHWVNGVFIAELTANSANKFSVQGTITYEFATKIASVDLHFGNLVLKTWMPPEFKPRYSGVAQAQLKWHGHLNTLDGAIGEVHLNLDGARISNPLILRRVLAPKGLRTPDEIFFKTAQLNFHYEDNSFSLTDGRLDLPGILTASLTGSLTSPDKTLDADIKWQGLTLENFLPDTLADQFSGDLDGHVVIHVTNWKMGDGSYAGEMNLIRGRLRQTSPQFLIARFLDNRALLDMAIDRASFSWHWSKSGLAVNDLDLRAGDDLGVQGHLAVDLSRDISGVLWLGVQPTYLGSLYGLGDDVFKRKDDGLRWAEVHLSGSVRHPQQDLSSQLTAQLSSHPTAIFPLAGKLISWKVGDLFGANEDWRPPSASVQVAQDRPATLKSSK